MVLLRIQNVGVGIKALHAVLKSLRMGFRVLKIGPQGLASLMNDGVK